MAILILDFETRREKYRDRTRDRIYSLVSCEFESHQGDRERAILKSNALKGVGDKLCQRCATSFACKGRRAWNKGASMEKKTNIRKEQYDEVAIRKNIEYLDPIPRTTHTKIRWKCQFGHIWETSYNNISRTGNCPHCAGNAPKTEDEYFILAKNLNIEYLGSYPKSVVSLTNWKCKCGEKFQRSYHQLKDSKALCEKCARMAIVLANFKGYKEISKSYWERIRYGAITRGLEFNITIEFGYELFVKQNYKCALTGIEINLGVLGERTGNTSATASLDRINSDLGYTEDNIQWVHKDINYIKMDLPQNYFIHLCKLVAENNK
jgi:hypothetical protein